MTTPQISRRTVTAGLAWSVPAVAAVSAAPAFAISPTCVTGTTGAAVKFPGGSTLIKQGYGFPITVTNPTRSALRVSPRTFTIDFDNKDDATGRVELYSADPCQGGVLLGTGDDALVIQPGDTASYFLVVSETGNSANSSGCITASVDVALVQDQAPVENLCADYTFEKVCFSATPPTATC